MKAAGCLFLVVVEIIFFALIGNWMEHRNDIETKSSDSIDQVTNAEEVGDGGSSDIGTYVGPYTDRNGHFHQGHVRKSYNLRPDAYRRRASSRYYNHTHIRRHSR